MTSSSSRIPRWPGGSTASGTGTCGSTRRTSSATAFPPFLEPLLFLAGVGLGLGKYITQSMEGLHYIEFLGTGLLVTASMFTAAFECTFGTFIRLEFEKVYDGMLAAPITANNLIVGEILWAGTKGLFFSFSVLCVLAAFGIVPFCPQPARGPGRIRDRRDVRGAVPGGDLVRQDDQPLQLLSDGRSLADVLLLRRGLSDQRPARCHPTGGGADAADPRGPPGAGHMCLACSGWAGVGPALYRGLLRGRGISGGESSQAAFGQLTAQRSSRAEPRDLSDSSGHPASAFSPERTRGGSRRTVGGD